MKKALSCLTIMVSFLLLLTTAAFAGMAPTDLEIIEESAGTNVQTSIGLGIGAAPEYEGSEDYEPVAIPFVNVRWGNQGQYAMLAGNRLMVNLLNDTWQFGPILQYRKERDNVKNDVVDDMDKIDAATEAGAFVAYKTGPWKMGIDWVTDVSDEYNGYLITLKGAYTCTAMQDFIVTTTLSTTYADENYMETYFGVYDWNRGSNTQADVPNYDADAGIKDVALSIVGNYSINQKWSVIGIAAIKQLVDDAADSPLVDDEGSETQGFVGVIAVYNF